MFHQNGMKNDPTCCRYYITVTNYMIEGHVIITSLLIFYKISFLTCQEYVDSCGGQIGNKEWSMFPPRTGFFDEETPSNSGVRLG